MVYWISDKVKKYHYSSLAGGPIQLLMGLDRLLVDLMDFGLEYSFDCSQTNPSCLFFANFLKGKHLRIHSHTLAQVPHHIQSGVTEVLTNYSLILTSTICWSVIIMINLYLVNEKKAVPWWKKVCFPFKIMVFSHGHWHFDGRIKEPKSWHEPPSQPDPSNWKCQLTTCKLKGLQYLLIRFGLHLWVKVQLVRLG